MFLLLYLQHWRAVPELLTNSLKFLIMNMVLATTYANDPSLKDSLLNRSLLYRASGAHSLPLHLVITQAMVPWDLHMTDTKTTCGDVDLRRGIPTSLAKSVSFHGIVLLMGLFSLGVPAD